MLAGDGDLRLRLRQLRQLRCSLAPQVQEMPPRVGTLRAGLEGKTPTGAGLKV